MARSVDRRAAVSASVSWVTTRCWSGKRRQAVLHLLLRLQDRVLIIEHGLLKLGVLHPHLVDQPAIVEDRENQAGARVDRAALPVEHVRQRIVARIVSDEPELAGQRKSRIHIGLGHADQRRLRGRRQPGRPHVRTPAQQVLGMPTATSAGAVGIRLGPGQMPVNFIRRFTQQHRETVFVLGQASFQLREFAPRFAQVASWPVARRSSLVSPALNWAVAMRRLSFCVSTFLRATLQPFLQGADVDIAAGNIGDQRDQRVVVGGNRAQERGAVGFNAPAVLAPEINLPRGGKQQLVGDVIRGQWPGSFAAFSRE